MSIVPGKLNGVMTYGTGAAQLDRSFAIDREWISRRFHCGGQFTATCARATLAQIRIGIGGLMAVVPGDQQTPWREKLDLEWSEIHRLLLFLIGIPFPSIPQ